MGVREGGGGGRFEHARVAEVVGGSGSGVVVREIGVREGGEREVWGDSPTLATFRRESVREMRESARERRERRESNLSYSTTSRRESGVSISSRRSSRRESVISVRETGEGVKEGGESSSGAETVSPPPPNSSKNVEKKGGLRPLSLGTHEVRARRWRDAMEELRKM